MGKGILTKDGWVVDEGEVESTGDQTTTIRKLNARVKSLVAENEELRTLNEELREAMKYNAGIVRAVEIKNAVEALSPESNEDWIADGLPRVEVVCGLLDDDTITREEIEQACPGYVRPEATASADDPGSPAA